MPTQHVLLPLEDNKCRRRFDGAHASPVPSTTTMLATPSPFPLTTPCNGCCPQHCRQSAARAAERRCQLPDLRRGLCLRWMDWKHLPVCLTVFFTALSSSLSVPRAVSALNMEAGCDLWVNGISVAGRRETDNSLAAFISGSACGPVVGCKSTWPWRQHIGVALVNFEDRAGGKSFMVEAFSKVWIALCVGMTLFPEWSDLVMLLGHPS